MFIWYGSRKRESCQLWTPVESTDSNANGQRVRVALGRTWHCCDEAAVQAQSAVVPLPPPTTVRVWRHLGLRRLSATPPGCPAARPCDAARRHDESKAAPSQEDSCPIKSCMHGHFLDVYVALRSTRCRPEPATLKRSPNDVR